MVNVNFKSKGLKATEYLHCKNGKAHLPANFKKHYIVVMTPFRLPCRLIATGTNGEVRPEQGIRCL